MLVYACTQKKLIFMYSKKNLYSFVEYYKILSKKSLIMSKSNIYFNVITLIKELDLRFAVM